MTDETITSLRCALRGELLTAGTPEYDAARTLWNGMIDKRPALIVRCRGAADVVTAVNFAREHELLLSARGGGHNVAGLALCDRGLTIDLSLMRGIRVDPSARTVRAEGGVTWGDLDREALSFGLATTGGMVSSTGIAGLTLGGGLGWQMARHGLASDNLLSADVVLADGRLLTASASQHEDLFWALRGGGGNFGVVTSFEYQLHAMEPTFAGGMVLYPMDQAREVLRFYRDYSHNAPDDLTAFAGLLTTPTASTSWRSSRRGSARPSRPNSSSRRFGSSDLPRPILSGRSHTVICRPCSIPQCRRGCVVTGSQGTSPNCQMTCWT